MNKGLEDFYTVIDKFAQQMVIANNETLNATNITYANKYLYRVPQVINIEKELKAFDIIKTNNVDIFFLRNNCDRVEEYNREINNCTMYYCYGNCRELTKQEFDLLKEVLKNE